MNRKEFLKTATSISLGFTGLGLFWNCTKNRANTQTQIESIYGKLNSDPNGIFDLPEGFRYSIVSRTSKKMSDGLLTPHRPDGMGAFKGGRNTCIIVRNHEVNPGASTSEGPWGKEFELLKPQHLPSIYNPEQQKQPSLGGTTTFVWDTKEQKLVTDFLSLSGTLRNCAGGVTPWGSWLTCEEIFEKTSKRYRNHGYVFEVPAQSSPFLAPAIPLKAMGRFNHEAVAIDPKTGIVYLTEDDHQGLLYRFIPNRKEQLQHGGKLQALQIIEQPSADTRNWNNTFLQQGQTVQTKWLDLEDIDATESPLKDRGFNLGAARFARGEGMWYGQNHVFFACTNGGQKKLGQIWKYQPSFYEGKEGEKNHPGKLTLFIESHDKSIIENADNITIAPWGDLIVCEDGENEQFLIGITPKAEIYRLGKNILSSSELAGAVFSPDGSTLFINIQHDGITLAITGPWKS